jgi:hypothetical protein
MSSRSSFRSISLKGSVHLVVICAIEVGESDVVLESGVAAWTGVIGLGEVRGLSTCAARSLSLGGGVDRSERRRRGEVGASPEGFLFADKRALGSGTDAFGGMVSCGGWIGGACCRGGNV